MVRLELSTLLPIEKLRDFTHNGGREWCRNTFQGNWEYTFDYDWLHIEDERDYAMFLLRWS